MKLKLFFIFFILFTQSVFGVEKTIDPNGWNKVNIKANGPNIEIKINGITTAKYIEETDVPTKGCICLQTHSGNPYEVWYRNIYLTNL